LVWGESVRSIQLVRDAPDLLNDVSIQDSLDPWDIEDDGTAMPLPSGVMHGEDQKF
jgi:hypothetical protein